MIRLLVKILLKLQGKFYFKRENYASKSLGKNFFNLSTTGYNVKTYNFVDPSK